MLPEAQNHAYDTFSASVRQNDILDPKTSRLIYLAVAMAVGCYP
jgi:alkylhydroperoxidase/carboxymuconolactone decarboxylase family protein YurZ